MSETRSVTEKVYLVFVSGRYRSFSNLKRSFRPGKGLSDPEKVFDNPESATAYRDYLGRGLEKQSPYMIEIKEFDVEDSFRIGR
jgi:hypothetical protein